MKKSSGKVVRYNKWGYIFLIPFIVVYVIFQLIPLISTIYNSFFENYMSGRLYVHRQRFYARVDRAYILRCHRYDVLPGHLLRAHMLAQDTDEGLVVHLLDALQLAHLLYICT